MNDNTKNVCDNHAQVIQGDIWVVQLIVDALMKGQQFSTSKFSSTLGVRQGTDMSGTFVYDGTPEKSKAWIRVRFNDINWREAMRIVKQEGYHLFACWGVQNTNRSYVVRKDESLPYKKCCKKIF